MRKLEKRDKNHQKKYGNSSFGADNSKNLSIMNFQVLKTVLCFKYNYCLQLTCLLTIVQEEILPTKYSDFTIFLTQKVKRGKTFPLSYVL